MGARQQGCWSEHIWGGLRVAGEGAEGQHCKAASGEWALQPGWPQDTQLAFFTPSCRAQHQHSTAQRRHSSNTL